MIRILRHYQRTIFGVLVVAAAVLAMGGFGLGRFYMGGTKQRGAITVNGKAISYESFHRLRRKSHEGQQIVDRLINSSLLEQELKQLGFTAGSEEVKLSIRSLFPKGVTDDAYNALLRDQGMSSDEFLRELKNDITATQFSYILQDASQAAALETKSIVEREETKYDVSYVVFNPSDFVGKVTIPDDAALQTFYNDNSINFEMPERVGYDFAVIDPRDFEATLQVYPEDVETYYADNINRFEIPEQLRVRYIRLSIPEKATPEQKEEIKKNAQTVLEAANGGEDFAKLASEHSDDTATKAIGGDLGWIKPGSMPKQFDNAVFAKKDGGVADLIETASAYIVAKVDEYRERKAKPLDEVRGEIEKEVRKRESPVYASEHAHKLLGEWTTKAEQSLKDFTAAKNLSAKINTVRASGAELLSKDKDPDSGLNGLTKKILEFPGEDRQVVEIGDRSILVQILKYRERETPPYAESKDRVAEEYRRKESVTLAEKAGREFAASLKASGTGLSLEAAALKAGLNVERAQDLQSEKPTSPLFKDENVHGAVFSVTNSGSISELIRSGSSSYVFQITAIKKADPAEIEKKIAQARYMVSWENGQILLESFINKLKASAKIDVDPNLMAGDAVAE